MIKSKQLKNIFNITPHRNFLSSLTSWVLREYSDPFYLANITILLPSRRACLEIKKCFLKMAKNEAVILPRILAIGDVDYDEMLFAGSAVQSDNSKVEYQLRLIAEIQKWNQRTNLFGKNISIAALAEIADNLQTFLGEVEKEGLNLENLSTIDDGELASHKQQILKFLQYFGSVWQNIMVKDGLIGAAKSRNLMLKNYSDHLQKNGSQYPIIAAGSTGSVYATSELLKTISKLENGKVILFGLDKNLDENIWQKIGENHPQFMLKRLLEKMEISRGDVEDLSRKQGDDAVDLGFILCSLAMLPAEFSDRWVAASLAPSLAPSLAVSFASALSLQTAAHTKIETENEFDEAKIIALLMRQTLESKGKTAALISNDKKLIQLVKENLSTWQIEVDDSASCNLAESEIANYLFLIGEFCSNDFNAVNLLAVLKHSLSGFKGEFLKVLEMKIFRDVVKFSSFDEVILKLKDDGLRGFVAQIAQIFQPLINEFKKNQVDFKGMVELHFDCLASLRAATQNIDGDDELAEFYQEILTTKNNFNLEPQSYNRLLKNLLKNYQFRKFGQFHPRLHILSTMEARLMNYDLTIVSGLCEGEFPSKTSDDWLGNKIRAEFGLSSGAKKIGISAYDFCNYLGNQKVVLLYPKNQNNSPTIKSRFLLKLETVLKVNGLQSWLKNGEEYLQLLALNSAEKTVVRANPKPETKLQKISATDFSKWLRNPYYIYAKRILELKPLKQIEQDASFAEFGNFVHKTLELFVKNYPEIGLLDCGKKIFPNYFPDPTSHLLWWAKFENIAGWFSKQEIELRKILQESFVEVEVEAIVSGVILTTKIDRVNLYLDGSFEIVDYKTGSLPTQKDIKSGLEPQLAVEAFVLSKGKIKNYSELKINQMNNLQYQNLKGKDQNEVKNLADIDELIAAADDGIIRLLKIFNDQNSANNLGNNLGYICCPNADIYKEDDYWHLGRVGEL